ncbi:prepilin peptidase [Arenivirga flava]|uniref:Prepilin type IV endopeptidase peptidase domain-containing protein n=1 Tax=Arenivirga flava TaxID=1930060 RepID=A0AA37ULM8_9MICO|nr:A24 family peptidase [Arenivirga flava]GMA28820.1 hypothetical protein GCM10025874_20730 [Arenivirga flava]
MQPLQTPSAPWLRGWTPLQLALLGASAAALMAMVVARVGPDPAMLLLAASAPLIAAIDLRWRIVPNRLVLPLIGALLVAVAASAVLEAQPLRIVGALLGAAAMSAVYLAPAVLTRRAMGMGDVKLALAIGAVLGASGWQTWLLGVLAGFIAGAAFGLALLLARRATLRSRMPYAPAMLVGALLVLLA